MEEVKKTKEVKKPKEVNQGSDNFVNPFEAGVNYKMFTDAIPEGISIEEYCKDKLADEQIAFLVEDLKHYKK